MSLRTPHFATLYTTSANDLFADFFVPALEQAMYYDRGVGYFSSGWLRLGALGMARFARNVTAFFGYRCPVCISQTEVRFHGE